MRVAIVHDWLVTYRGGEKVLESLASLYPEAPIYTLFYDPDAMPESLRKRTIIYPRFLNKLKRFRKMLLPFFPSVIEAFDLFEFDLIISTSSCVAKGVIPGPEGKHICYLHSPMRYIWDQQQHYLGRLSKIPVLSVLVSWLLNYLRIWDFTSAQRVDQFVVNSRFVGKRVTKYYRRPFVVLHPPIAVDKFPLKETDKSGEYFVAAGAFVPYKRFDLAIKACEKVGAKLIVAGSGPLEDELREMAGSNVTFEIAPPDGELVKLIQGARALLFPCVEDFGMIAVESMCCGTPVLALKKRGALDYIRPGINGDFIESDTVESLAEALEAFADAKYDHAAVRESAVHLDEESFLRRFLDDIAVMQEGDLG